MSFRFDLHSFPIVGGAVIICGVVGDIHSEFLGPFVIHHYLCNGGGTASCGTVLVRAISALVCGTKTVVWFHLVPFDIAEQYVAHGIYSVTFGSTCLKLIHNLQCLGIAFCHSVKRLLVCP